MSETTQIAFSGWMVKQTMVYPYNGTLFSNTNRWTIVTHTTWMTLKEIMLNKRSQSQKFFFVWNLPK